MIREVYDAKLVQLEEFETKENIAKFVENRLSEEQLRFEEKVQLASDQLWDKIPEVINKVAKETMGKPTILI